MKTKFLSVALSLLSVMSFSAGAEFRIYRHVPELNFKVDENIVEEEAREAFFIAMQGYTCQLPSVDSYCTVPLRWHNNTDNEVSVWRDGNKLATGYSGYIEATVRLGQSFDYYIIKGTEKNGQVVDAAKVTAVYDPNAVQGSLRSNNNGKCEITYGNKSCEQVISWETNSPAASVWLVKRNGSEKIQDIFTSSGSLNVDIGNYANLYQLRSGKTLESALLASISVEGKTLDYSGNMILEEGSTCLIASAEEMCELPVTWQSENRTSVWVNNKRQTEPSTGGVGLIKVPFGKHKVYLRPENVLGTNIATLDAEAKISDVKATITNNGSVCEIGYAEKSCQSSVTITSNLPVVYLFKGESYLASGSTFNRNIEHTESGIVYTLREGATRNSQILATYLAKADKQKPFGELVIDGECVFEYKGSTCQLPASFNANVEGIVIDSKGKHYSAYSSLWGQSYAKQDDFVVKLTNDGNKTTTENFMLKSVVRGTSWLNLETIDQKSITGVLKQNSGTLSAISSTSCNLPSNKLTCTINVAYTASAAKVSIWRQDGVNVYTGTASSTERTVTLPLLEGENTFYLKEGLENYPGSLAEIKLTGVKIDYYASLDQDSEKTCYATIWNGSCSFSLKINSNLQNEWYSVYYMVSSNDNYDYYAKLDSFSVGNATMTHSIQVKGGEELVKRKIIIASDLKDRLYDEKIPGTVSSSYKLSTVILYDEFELEAYPSGFDVSEYSDSGVFTCRLYIDSDYCTLSATYLYSFNTLAKDYTSSICIMNGNTVKGSRTLTGTSSNISGSTNVSSSFYPGRATSVIIKNNSASYCDSAGMPAVFSKDIEVDYQYIKADEVKAVFKNKQASCNLLYRGDTSCEIKLYSGYLSSTDVEKTAGTGNKRPTVYVKRLNDGVNSTPAVQSSSILTSQNNGTAHNIRINEGESNVVVGLMVLTGEAPSDNDPMIDSAVINHGYVPATADIYLQRAVLQESLWAAIKLSSTTYYYYNSTSINALSSRFPGIFVNDQRCLIHHQSDKCLIQIAVQSKSGASSVFLDGEYLGDVLESSSCSTYRTPSACGYAWHTAELPAGDHLIQVYDGLGESAKNNELVAEKSILAVRPAYTGSITLATRKLRYYGAVEDFVITASANRKAYLFKKGENKVLSQNTLNTYVEYESLSFTDSLAAGQYTYILGTHADMNNPSFEVLDEKTLVVEHENNTLALRPTVGKEFYYNQCYQATYETGCEINFSYKGAELSALADTKPYAAVCLVDHADKLKKAGELSRRTTFQSMVARIERTSKAIYFYDGLVCPENIHQSDMPLLGKIENLSVNDVAPPAATIAQSSSYNNFSNENEGFRCTLTYEGNTNCRFYSRVTPVGQLIDGKSMFTIGVWIDGQDYLSGAAIGTVSPSYPITNISSRRMDVVVCEAQEPSKTGCPYSPEKVIATAMLNVDLKSYDYTVSLPSGNTCLVPPMGETACYVAMEISSSSPQISLINSKGTVVATATGSTGTLLKKTELIDLSNDGIHEYKVITGSDPKNSVVKSFVVKSRKMTDEDFSLMDSSGSPIERNSVLDSVAVVDPLGLNGDLTYIVSDRSVNYLNNIGPVKLFINNLTTEQSVIGFGDGSHLYSSPSYTLVNERLSSAAKRTFSVKMTWQNELKTTNYNVHAFTVPYKLIGYSGEPYTATPLPGTSSVASSLGSETNTCYGNLCLNLKNTQVNISGTVMKANGSCSNCGTIALRKVSITNAAGQQRQFRLSLGGGYTHHRIFYRVVDTNTISDPTVTFKGQVRPINMNGEWHALEFESIKGGEVLDFSWMGNAAGTGAIEFFGRYERD